MHAMSNVEFFSRPSVLFLFLCQRDSSETAEENFMKLGSYERHTVLMRIFAGNSEFFSWELRPY